MKREIDIPEVLDEFINQFIHSHSKFGNLSELVVAALDFYLKKEGFLHSNILPLDKSE